MAVHLCVSLECNKNDAQCPPSRRYPDETRSCIPDASEQVAPDEGSNCMCRLPVQKEDTASIDEALKAAEWLTQEELQQEQQKIIASWRKAKRLRRIPGRHNACIGAGDGAQ